MLTRSLILPFALFALHSFCLGQFDPGAGQASQAVTGISVSGTATRNETPDIAILSLGVAKTNSKLASAKTEADQAMTRVQAAVRKAGVSLPDIQTSEYRIFAVAATKTTPRQWKVSHEITVKVRKVPSAGLVLDAAVNAGATDVSQISYTLENLVASRSKARVDAMRVARQKAEELAKLAGVSLGPVLNVVETSDYDSYAQTANYALNDNDNVFIARTNSPVRSGQISVVVRVDVRFAIVYEKSQR